MADFAAKMKDPNKSFKTSLKKVSELFIIINVVYVLYVSTECCGESVIWLNKGKERKKQEKKENKKPLEKRTLLDKMYALSYIGI